MFENRLTRRGFLKVAGALTLSHFVPPMALSQQGAPKENVLIVLFDAFSASNISLYGYRRPTTPHLERLAEKAVVYHQHLAGGNFTTPGTATLLTGVMPWTHRAMGFNDVVAEAFARKSLFHALPTYNALAYTHNLLANTLLKDFFADLNGLTPREKLYLQGDQWISWLFQGDDDISSVGWQRAVNRQLDGSVYSLFLSRLYEGYKNRQLADVRKAFPRGLPEVAGTNNFLLEDSINWLQNQLTASPQPFLGYYHLLPPHDPYHTRADFYNTFAADGYHPPDKPLHILTDHHSPQKLAERRQEYDEYILYVDAEFNRLYTFLETEGFLENTWLVFTSDHGEMFERGFRGHRTKVLHQPVIHIPLLIFPPGQTTRVDIHEPTSAIDILPTLAAVTGNPNPPWAEGRVLPPFANAAPREVFSIQMEGLDKAGHVTKGTVSLVRAPYKLMVYFGFVEEVPAQNGTWVELYDLMADPEERDDLAITHKEIANEMLAAVKTKMNEVGAFVPTSE
jgi:arylsulfatase A-like enzyme